MSGDEATRSAAPVKRRTKSRAIRLLVMEDGVLRTFDLHPTASVLVGRDANAQLRLENLSVSRKHARIVAGGGAITITDCTSRNGVVVNGVKVTGAQALVRRDVVSIGDVTIVVAGPVPFGVGVEAAEHELRLGQTVITLADPAMLEIFEVIRRHAANDFPVLIAGEAGTGKESAAQALHHLSKRAAEPLVVFNCAALAPGLVDSELFGNEANSHTDGKTATKGFFEQAHRGTLFFDEVGELSPDVQAKLLRVLETRRVRRIKGAAEIAVDVRFVAATNRNLKEDVVAGRFRRDLFDRIAAVTITLPPLRDRPHDLAVLARQTLDLARKRLACEPMQISHAVWPLLFRHSWPGNVRELKNLMNELAAGLTCRVVEPDHIESRLSLDVPTTEPAPVRQAAAEGLSLNDELTSLERQRMVDALRATRGVKEHAAIALKMSISTFKGRFKKYDIHPWEWRD